MRVQTAQQTVQQPPPRRATDSAEMNGASSPHRAGHSVGIHPEDRPYLSDEQRQSPRQQTQQRPVQFQYDDETGDEEDAIYDTRSPNSARRYQVPVAQAPHTVVRYHRQQVPPRSSRTQAVPPPVPSAQQQRTHDRTTDTKAARARKTRRREWHWLVYVGLTMCAGIVLYVGGVLVLHWWQTVQDDLHYGRPRTYQCDARVGHGDAHTPSHFLALNLHKQVEVIELPGGDATKARVYIGPTLVGDGQDLTPVTLEFRDVNRDGKPDMILHIGDSQTVFLNENGTFRLATPSDPIIV